MDKITFENLPSENTAISAANMNLLQSNVEKSVNYIGATQPATTEKVWQKKGKNLFNKNNSITGYRLAPEGTLYIDNDYMASDYIKVVNNTQYVANWQVATKDCICYYTESKTFISRNTSNSVFTTPSNCSYIRIAIQISQANTAQVEQGSTATTYEAYVDKEILVKNDNGVFEKIYSENELNQEKYSLGEQRIGTWIDGKPIYRKVVSKKVTTTGSTNIAHEISNIDIITNLRGFIDLTGGVFVPIPQNTSNGAIGNIQLWSSRSNIAFNNSVSLSNYTVYFIFEYTKTTD